MASIIFDPDRREYDLEGDGVCNSESWIASTDTSHPPLGDMSWHSSCCEDPNASDSSSCRRGWTDAIVSLQAYDHDKLETERSIVLDTGDYYSPPGLNMTIAMCGVEDGLANVKLFDTILPTKCHGYVRYHAANDQPLSSFEKSRLFRKGYLGCSWRSHLPDEFVVNPCLEGATPR